MSEHVHDDHIISRQTYATIFGILLVLLILTVGAAEINLGRLNFALAMFIATVKAILIVIYFMHLKASTQLVRVWAAAGFIFLLILLAFTFGDYVARFPTIFGS